ncbi:glycosyltransferase family 2 protein [Leeuwenhoekiella sp. LLG6367-2.1]|uniref:glycosyltransferase family 2 protein n=1 Tax=Leeuwenhoekiella sp. LLG6367-2.1 TaxID=3160833 RepID=UPI00386AA4CF
MLAVVIPYYKIDFFEETIKSLVHQTCLDFKVYIGDDASENSPVQILSKYQQLLEITYHKFERNLGNKSLTGHWDRCIALSKKEPWIMLLGDDDYISSNYIEQWYNHLPRFEAKTNVVRFASYDLYQQSGNLSKFCTHPSWELPTEAFWRKCIYDTRSSLSEYFFARSSYMKFGFYNYDLAWCSDDRAWLEFSEGLPIYTINDSFAVIRISDKSITGQNTNLLRKSKVKILFYKFLLSNYIKLYSKDQISLLKGRLENTIRGNRQLTYREWLLLLKIHLQYLSAKELKKFGKRTLKVSLNKPVI